MVQGASDNEARVRAAPDMGVRVCECVHKFK